jgi:superfamily II DNA or RNA helicase
LHETGVLATTTAFGKTVIGAWLIAQRAVSTLVLVQLLDQWVERLSMFLGLRRRASDASVVVATGHGAPRCGDHAEPGP